jgi:hypothetical protein
MSISWHSKLSIKVVMEESLNKSLLLLVLFFRSGVST